jgi:hypothetical protein
MTAVRRGRPAQGLPVVVTVPCRNQVGETSARGLTAA